MKKLIAQTYVIRCKGRDNSGGEVLAKSVEAKVKIEQYPGTNNLSSIVSCQYNTGSHGQRCKAYTKCTDKIGEDIGCPYSFDIPYALEKRRL